jgi:hypothetical protein
MPTVAREGPALVQYEDSELVSASGDKDTKDGRHRVLTGEWTCSLSSILVENENSKRIVGEVITS